MTPTTQAIRSLLHHLFDQNQSKPASIYQHEYQNLVGRYADTTRGAVGEDTKRVPASSDHRLLPPPDPLGSAPGALDTTIRVVASHQSTNSSRSPNAHMDYSSHIEYTTTYVPATLHLSPRHRALRLRSSRFGGRSTWLGSRQGALILGWSTALDVGLGRLQSI